MLDTYKVTIYFLMRNNGIFCSLLIRLYHMVALSMYMHTMYSRPHYSYLYHYYVACMVLPMFQNRRCFCFVLNQTSLTLTKFIEKCINIYYIKLFPLNPS
jgi:hypothetical protein